MRIAVSDLSFAYPDQPDRPIFSHASATFAAGRVSVVLGSSGSGKSTLLKLFAGLLNHTSCSGQISYGPHATSPDEMARNGSLSISLQKSACLPWATVFQNVVIGLKLQNKDGYSAPAHDLLQRFGLGDWVTSYPSSLSAGMQARVALCRAFISKPAVVLLDEPFASLDIGWKQQLYKYLLAVAAKNGTTTILVTHDLLEALFLADDVFIICERARTLAACLADNPLKQSSGALSITALIADPHFSQLFGMLHESLTTS